MKERTLLHLNKNTISPWSIDKILSEESYSVFIDCIYKQEVYLANSLEGFNKLFNIDSLLELLNTRRLSFPRCRLIKNGAIIPPASYTERKAGSLGEIINSLNVPKVTQLIVEGTTLVIDFCEDIWRGINEVCSDFSTLFSEKTGATHSLVLAKRLVLPLTGTIVMSLFINLAGRKDGKSILRLSICH